MSNETYTPSHPQRFVVKFLPGSFGACLQAARPFLVGDIVAHIEGTKTDSKSYQTVQCGSHDEHLALNSDLRYANHSCQPNTIWNMSSPDPAAWHVQTIKDINEGDEITFFYPSTEWEMDQPFPCNCGSQSCLGEIRGAKYLSLDVISERGFVSPGILQLIKDREIHG